MRINRIADYNQATGLKKPEHPLLSLNIIQNNDNTPKEKTEITCDFYIICYKKIEEGSILYGKTKYDHNNGSMYFMKPGQTIIIQDLKIKYKGFFINVHEDYLMGHPLFKNIQEYNYFDYEINEALHLSPKEEEIMWSLFNKMQVEYHNNQDEFSKSIILSHMDSLLQYAQRYYRRQFIDRKPLSGITVSKFNAELEDYFDKKLVLEHGLPSVNHMAKQLLVSPKYLSDLLKQETGKTAMELIHLYVVKQAKNMLVEGGRTISEIADTLGFENAPYFSRLFKKEVGISPSEYVSRLN